MTVGDVQVKPPYPRAQRVSRPMSPYSIGSVQVVPSEGPVGAEIRGVDFTQRIPAATIDAILSAWADHLVLVWRKQDLSVEQLMRVGAIFGELENMSHVAVEADLPPEICTIEYDPDFNKNLDAAPENYRFGDQGKSLLWHTDNSYREIPPRSSLLYMKEAPENGASTNFLNMITAYNDLPADLASKIEGRWAKHDRTQNSAGVIRKGLTPPEDVSKGTGVEHPLVRILPLTGQRALYLGRRPYQYICGYDVPTSEAILDKLWAHCVNEKYVWRRSRQPVGDLILWDNRSVMHARDEIEVPRRRLAYRLQMLGEQPIASARRVDS
jgi:taurine dioxygenase